MPLGQRDILLLVRAQDMASQTLGKIGRAFGDLDSQQQQAANKSLQVGAAIMASGAAIGYMGKQGLDFYADATKMATEYNQAAALTFTQLDKQVGSLRQIKDIGLEVAREIPAPLEQMQKTLFDIFSSMDVSVQESEGLLRNFAKGAVAGQTDVQVAGRATIAIMNAWKLPVSEVNRVMDVQFQLIRKGVGTYEEFATTIGRSIPSAARAGQSVETLAGMLAFLTRNGLSAAMASASAGRAFDAMANSKTVDKAKEMFGIDFRSANGEFKTMSEIVQLLSDRLGKMTAPDRAAALQELFKGSGGTIQARRFWDLALTNSTEFIGLVDSMKDSAGVMDQAYNVMFEQPQSQMQLFQNNLDAIRIEVGDMLLPVLNRMLKVGMSLMNWFNDLSPATKKFIAIFGLVASIVALVGGAVAFVIGLFLTFSAAAAMAGIAMGTIALVGGIVTAAILALIGVGILLVMHWDTIKNAAGVVWGWIQQAIEVFVSIASSALSGFWEVVQTVFNAIGAIAKWLWSNVLEPFFSYIGAVITGVIIPAAQLLGDIFTVVFNTIMVVARFAWDVIRTIFEAWYNIMVVVLGPAINVMRDHVSTAWNVISSVISWAWNNVIKPVWDALAHYIGVIIIARINMLRDAWSGFWDVASTVAKSAWNATETVVRNGVNTLISLLNGLLSNSSSVINNLIGVYNAIPGVDNIDKITVGQIPKLHSGGMVTAGAMGSREVLRVLEVGEGVVSRRGMSTLGSSGLAEINSGSAPSGASLVVAEGAVQIHINGNADEATMDKLVAELDSMFRDLYNDMRAKR